MSDTSYAVFQHYGTNAQRLAFTPSPPATGQPIYEWYETDTDTQWTYTTSWHQVSGAGGAVTASGTLTSGKAIIGGGTSVVTASSLTAQFVGSSSGTQAAASMSTGKLLGRTTASSGAVEEITPGASLVFLGGALNGRIVQVVNTHTGASATGTTTIPDDDTIPQNTEGTEFMTLAVTPTSATNKLKIEVVFVGACGTGARTIAVALFQDSAADALAVAVQTTPTAGYVQNIGFSHYMTSGTTSATTFKIRAGVGTSGTVTFNGSAGSRLYGGVLESSITITEISV